MKRMEQLKNSATFKQMCDDFLSTTAIDPSLPGKFGVKRGLRNSDGSGVVAGITNVCCVHGYVISECDKQPIEGELIYRGYNIRDIVNDVLSSGRYGYEEVAYLLLFGMLPDERQLTTFSRLIAEYRDLPMYFSEDVIIRNPSPNIMNKMAQAVLALYSYDSAPEDKSVESEMLKAISIISRLPAIMVTSYQAMRRFYHNDSMVMHQINKDESLAESILSTLRDDRSYTAEEAHLLDLCLMLHAEHGGGNNSTFPCRTVSSSGTDAYSAYAAAIGSLKGPRHGGANLKVMQMMQDIRTHVTDPQDKDAVRAYLSKLLAGEAFDGKGLIYGMGHAVYSISDPRERVLKSYVKKLAEAKGKTSDMALYSAIEEIAPQLIAEKRRIYKGVSPNVDFYSGFVYDMLGIPLELYTPLFAIARVVGWSAHRIEELVGMGKIIRPAYKSVMEEIE